LAPPGRPPLPLEASVDDPDHPAGTRFDDHTAIVDDGVAVFGVVGHHTLVLLPSILRHVPVEKRLALFEMIEDRFAVQARISTPIAGLTGFYMTHELGAWSC